MSYLLDNVARTLASPATPRRKALKLLGGLLAGGVLSAVGIGRAAAQDEVQCGAGRCPKGKSCCQFKHIHVCCGASQTCSVCYDRWAIPYPCCVHGDTRMLF